MIKELWDSFIAYEQAATQTFLGTVIFVTVPVVIIMMLYMGFCGKSVPSDTCSCCGQKLPKEEDSK
jgi:hypothetical protein